MTTRRTSHQSSSSPGLGSIERMLVVCGAAHVHAEAQGFGKGKSGQGELSCPIEGCGGKVRYVVSEVNGHMMGACSTKGCASWME